jgi:hypothetical protein
MVRVLRRRYEQFARGERPQRLARDQRFSRRHQAGRLMDALAACLTTDRERALRAAPASALPARAMAGGGR